jgi:hypothetical protein
MKIRNLWRAIIIVVVAGMPAACAERDFEAAAAPSSVTASPMQQKHGETDAALPFHSEIVWEVEQVPMPAGTCPRALPEEPAGLSYLWLSRVRGTATSTHLGRGPYYAELCVYGSLTNPGAAPPENGIPSGWYVDVEIWTAANGDQLRGSGGLIGFTAPPDTPGFKFIESLTFLNGGTGRFEYAEGSGTGIIDPVAQTAVFDGHIRYGKK